MVRGGIEEEKGGGAGDNDKRQEKKENRMCGRRGRKEGREIGM